MKQCRCWLLLFLLSSVGSVVSAQVCDGPVSADGNTAAGFSGDCLPDGQCHDYMLPAAQELCELSWYWAATDPFACSLAADPCSPVGECTQDPESLPVFSADDCVYTCTEFPNGTAACGAYYSYDNYDCKCSNEPPTVPLGGCDHPPWVSCLLTPKNICESSGFDYHGDGTDCEEPPVPASSTESCTVLVLALLFALYWAIRRP